MPEMEKILLLFSDSFFTSIIFYFGVDYVYDAIKIFGGMSLLKATLISALGQFCAGLVNYVLGMFLSSMIKMENDNYLKGFKAYHQYLFFLPLFACLPLWGAIFTVASGVFRQRFPYFAVFSALSYIIWTIICLI